MENEPLSPGFSCARRADQGPSWFTDREITMLVVMEGRFCQPICIVLSMYWTQKFALVVCP